MRMSSSTTRSQIRRTKRFSSEKQSGKPLLFPFHIHMANQPVLHAIQTLSPVIIERVIEPLFSSYRHFQRNYPKVDRYFIQTRIAMNADPPEPQNKLRIYVDAFQANAFGELVQVGGFRSRCLFRIAEHNLIFQLYGLKIPPNDVRFTLQKIRQILLDPKGTFPKTFKEWLEFGKEDGLKLSPYIYSPVFKNN